MSVTLRGPRVQFPSAIVQPTFVHYPDSDGQPMAENAPQRLCIVDTEFALRHHFASDPNVYVSADLLVYYRQGDPSKSVAPDILVAFGVPKRLRRSFKRWEEGKAPDVVFEFASEGTWEDDLDWKRGLYQGIGVREYFLFDPRGDFFDPVLQGFRRVEGPFEPIPGLPASECGLLGLSSQLLGLELWVRRSADPEMPYILRLYDSNTAAWLPAPDEAIARAQAAEAGLARLKAELARLRADE